METDTVKEKTPEKSAPRASTKHARKGATRSRKKKLTLRRRRKWSAALGAAAILLIVGCVLVRPRLTWILWALAAGVLAVGAGLLNLKKPLPKGVYTALTAVGAALALAAPIFLGFIPVYGQYVSSSARVTALSVADAYPESMALLDSVRTLDMRGSTVTDFEPVKGLKTLEHLDVRDNYAFTEAVHDEVAAALPGCAIRWSIPIAASHYDSDETDVDLTTQVLTNGQLSDILARYPDKRFTYQVNLPGGTVPSTAEEWTLQSGASLDADGLNQALALLPNVKRVDLRATRLPLDTVRALSEANPQVTFNFSFDVPQGELTSEDDRITVTKGTYDDVLTYLGFAEYMPNIQGVDIRSLKLTEEQVKDVQERSGDLIVAFTFSMFGKKVTSIDTKVVLDGVKVGSTDAVEPYLAYLPRLEQLDMCNCGIDNEAMAAFRDKHPEIKVVWRVKFGHWTLRTDAEIFSTLLYGNNHYGYTSKTYAPIQYCTELKMLDLGHNHMVDISGLANLKKLRILILACNKIEDISPLEGLEDLEYVELFSNHITDWSLLANKTKLLDLNINRNKVSDISPFLTCTSLERLWIGNCGISDAKLKQLRAGLPNCEVNVLSGNAPTTYGWRDHPRYKIIKEMYKTIRQEKPTYIPFTQAIETTP